MGVHVDIPAGFFTRLTPSMWRCPIGRRFSIFPTPTALTALASSPMDPSSSAAAAAVESPPPPPLFTPPTPQLPFLLPATMHPLHFPPPPYYGGGAPYGPPIAPPYAAVDPGAARLLMAARYGSWRPQQQKEARSRRRMERRRSAATWIRGQANRTSASASAPASTPVPARLSNVTRVPLLARPHGIKVGLLHLKFLLLKELRNSDVNPLGRIIIPKKEAEKHMPVLSVKDGIRLKVKDMLRTEEYWMMRYRFWPNYNSRMYVLENTGEFVKKYSLKCGDMIALYQDDKKQIYIRGKKAEGPCPPASVETEEDDEVQVLETIPGDRAVEYQRGESGVSSINTNANNPLAELPLEDPWPSSSVKENDLHFDASTADFTDFDITQFGKFSPFELSVDDFKMDEADENGAGGNYSMPMMEIKNL